MPLPRVLRLQARIAEVDEYIICGVYRSKF